MRVASAAAKSSKGTNFMNSGITMLPETDGQAAAVDSGKSLTKQRKFLPEVQGLRALAVLMVVIYHVWIGRISGGVDIFLLISAFLLTGQFVRKLEAGRPLELLKYWVHLFKRLLPLITLTLLTLVPPISSCLNCAGTVFLRRRGHRCSITKTGSWQRSQLTIMRRSTASPAHSSTSGLFPFKAKYLFYGRWFLRWPRC